MIFNFFKKKKNIDTSAIKNFNKALITIRDFIAFGEFEKAKLAINEIIKKETESFNQYLNEIDEKNKQKEIKGFNSKIDKLKKLKKENEKKQEKYNIELEEKLKKEELKNVNQKIKELTGKKEYFQALRLLNVFLDGKSGDIKYAEFGSNWKKILTKNIEKQKSQKEKEIKNNAYLEARQLIGDIKISNFDASKEIVPGDTLLNKLKKSVFFYYNFKKKLRDKKLYDEVNFLLTTNKQTDNLLLKSKIAAIHSGFSKKIYGEKVDGYEIFGQTHSADKISGDSMGYIENKNEYKFFIGDATGHGIKAGFIVSQLTKIFQDLAYKKDIFELSMNINNSLKQDLKSGNFITSVFFSISKKNNSKINLIGMGHEPLFLYKKQTNEVQKIIAGGLAAGIRLIKDISQIKQKEISMEEGDILITYTDGIIEAKNLDGEMFGFDRLMQNFKKYSQLNYSLENINKNLMIDLEKFIGKSKIDHDDISILLFKKNKDYDFLNEKNKALEFLKEHGLTKKELNVIKGKTHKEALEDIKIYQKQNSLKNILKNLDYLYRIGELPKLKQECIRYIKEGYIHKKLNFYLKKSIENENFFKIKQKNKKVQDKYNVLMELYKKGEYDTVIMECSEIIQKDGNI